MTLRRMLLVLVSIMLLLSFTVVSAQTPITDDMLTEFENLIESEMDYFNIPGAAVAVIAGDEVVYAQGFGVRDLASGEPFTTETQFRIGSTTKSMTSLIIAQLVDEGALTWDTLVTDLFPDFQTADPDLTAKLTVGDLMGMGTGLVSSQTDGLYWGDWDVDSILNAIANMKIGGEFGEFYAYNNEVYALSGYAAVLASQLEPTLESYKALMQERVFDPIGMSSAIITEDTTLLSDNYSESYETGLLSGEPTLMGNPPIGVIAPAGAVWTDIEDMAQYVITQMNGGVTPDGTRIVSAESLAETWEPGVLLEFDAPGIENTTYGKGWVLQTYHDIPIRYHDGGWAGYSTQMFILPADDVALIVFANSTEGALFGTALNYAFVERVHDLEPAAVETTHELTEQTRAQIEQARAVISTDVGDVSAFVGTYDNGWTVELRDDDTMWVSRGAWAFQAAYLTQLQQYILITGGAGGALVSFEKNGDTLTMVVNTGVEEILRVDKVS